MAEEPESVETEATSCGEDVPTTLGNEETLTPAIIQGVDNPEHSLSQTSSLTSLLPDGTQTPDFVPPKGQDDEDSLQGSTSGKTQDSTSLENPDDSKKSRLGSIDRNKILSLIGFAIGLTTTLAAMVLGIYRPWLPPAKVELKGTGATFPTALYLRWFSELQQKQPPIQIDYDVTDSTNGVDRFIAGTVDFAASDTALSYPEIQQVSRGVLLLPMTAGSIALAYNIPDVETGLKLPRDVYVDIFLGKIAKWNDPRIAAANPKIELPELDITVVYRSDASSTTGVFTKHLSAIAPEWGDKVGEGLTVKWLTGVGAAENQGVADRIQQTPGAISYIEYSYAKNNSLDVAALENKEGNYFTPSEGTTAKTIEAVELPEDLRGFISNPEGQESYPIVTYTWLLVYENYSDRNKAKAVEMMIEYGLTEGQTFSTELGYVPLPQTVVERVAKAGDRISPDYQIDVSQ